MAGALASFGVVWWLARVLGGHDDRLVLAVLLSVTLGRLQRPEPVRLRLLAFVVVPAACAVAARVGLWFDTRPGLGDAVFVVAVAGAIAVRRFGPAASRLGTLVTLPFVGALITPGSVPEPHREAWAALVGLVVVACVSAFRLVGGALPATVPARPDRTLRRVRVSTRMAVQMAVALSAAVAAGRNLYPEHWAWAVLTAYIVGSGNRGRRDVARKSVLRLVGAAAGTAAATLIAGHLAAGDRTSVVLIFLVLAVGAFLRPASYGYWAGCVTAALALLYGYYGEAGTTLLLHRLASIAVGAALGLAAAWFVLPISARGAARSSATPRAATTPAATHSDARTG